MIFRIFIVLSIIILFVWFKSSFKNRINYKFLLRQFFAPGKLIAGKNKEVNTYSSFHKFINIISYITSSGFLILALTGLIPAVIGMRMSGLLLIIHVTIAPLFCISLALGILFFANKNRFSQSDFNFLTNKVSGKEDELGYTLVKNIFYSKSFFWLYYFFSIFTIFSIILMLFPIFGSVGLETLLDIHKFSALLMTLSFVFHTGYLIISQKEN